MEQFKFNQQLAQGIVDGILKGYEKYSEERIQKSRDLHISGGYAWTKGNIIDHHTAEETKEMGIDFWKSKAGPTWGYLQFFHAEDKKLFIIKNQKYFNEKDFARGKTPLNTKQLNRSNYLSELSMINNDIDFDKIQRENDLHQGKEQLIIDLGFENEILEVAATEEFVAQFKEFYIVTYLIDEDHKISEITHYMPNPHDGKAIKIEDLTHYMLASTSNSSEIDYELLKKLSQEDQQTPADHLTAYGILLPGKEKEE